MYLVLRARVGLLIPILFRNIRSLAQNESLVFSVYELYKVWDHVLYIFFLLQYSP